MNEEELSEWHEVLVRKSILLKQMDENLKVREHSIAEMEKNLAAREEILKQQIKFLKLGIDVSEVLH